jgi:nucleoside-diphosphate-sugar epimerase
MNNLIIGDTSQLSYYFPDDYVRISSRNINYDELKNKNWNRVFLCFGENRKYITDLKLYDDINFYLTLDIIEHLKECSKSFILYSSCELWNQYDGAIDMSMRFNFYPSSYLQSKYKISKYVMENDKYFNVFVMFPFNFNSTYRTTNFLFGKIFDSIVNKKTIEIGDTYFYRDMIHPNFVVQESIQTNNHKIIGSGRMVFVNDFIRDLYSHYNLNYDDFVIENLDKFNEYEIRKEYYLSSQKSLYTYKELFNDTIIDIDNKFKLLHQ